MCKNKSSNVTCKLDYTTHKKYISCVVQSVVIVPSLIPNQMYIVKQAESSATIQTRV